MTTAARLIWQRHHFLHDTILIHLFNTVLAANDTAENKTTSLAQWSLYLWGKTGNQVCAMSGALSGMEPKQGGEGAGSCFYRARYERGRW